MKISMADHTRYKQFVPLRRVRLRRASVLGPLDGGLTWRHVIDHLPFYGAPKIPFVWQGAHEYGTSLSRDPHYELDVSALPTGTYSVLVQSGPIVYSHVLIRGGGMP